MRRIMFAAGISVLMMLYGCSDGQTPQGVVTAEMDGKTPISSISAAMTTSSTSEDSVYWVNNTLDFTDDNGNVWHMEREGPEGEPTTLRIYKNGVHTATVDFTYDAAGNLTGTTFHHPSSSAWFETNADGDIEDAESGSGGGDGGPVEMQSIEEPCDLDDPSPYCDDRCADEFVRMQEEAWDAAGVGGVYVVASLFGGPMNPIAIGVAVGFGIETGEAIGRLGIWASCKVSQ